MLFAITLFFTVLACFALRNPIHKHPKLFYGIAVLLVFVFLASSMLNLPYDLWKILFVLLQKCMLPLCLFIVVMYIGCLSRASKASRWLRPIRSELSVIACILTLGHIVVYAGVYLHPIINGTVKSNIAIAFIIALALILLLIPLGITSFNFVKRKMKTETWEKLQKWAYAFFGLTYAHVLLMLLPSALRGGTTALISIVAYSIVFIGYAIWRTTRALLNERQRKE